jgi:predicted ABC-type transport system involved in lysophospholipase L1 biosynthesis ATPase subunit
MARSVRGAPQEGGQAVKEISAVAVTVRGLKKVYGHGESSVEALGGIDLEVARGEFVAVMGPSGSGKSTLQHLIGGLDAPSAGEVRIGGEDLNRLKDDQLTLLRRRRIGFIFQAFNLLDMLRAAENVALPLVIDGVPEAEANQRALDVLDLVDIGHRRDHLPGQLSGGEQQRVAGGVAARLQTFRAAQGLRLQSKADFRAAVDQVIQSVLGFFWGLVVLVFVVASLGIVNTLTMNVLEQTRELGILRAVAMTRGQLARMVVAQAIALAFISLLPGAPLGILMAFLMHRSAVSVLGQEVVFYLDGWFITACCLAGLVIAVLAAFFPARRAARLSIVGALQNE